MVYIFWWAFDPPHLGHFAIIEAVLKHLHPEKIIIIPSGKRNDKAYKVDDYHRRNMLELFLSEIQDDRIFCDFHFFSIDSEMITRDVDMYAQKVYGNSLIHIFWSDTLSGMVDWDIEWYAAQKIHKLFIPRYGYEMPSLDETIRNASFLPGVSIPNISSTLVRSQIRSSNYSGIFTSIKEYIVENQLYTDWH